MSSRLAAARIARPAAIAQGWWVALALLAATVAGRAGLSAQAESTEPPPGEDAPPEESRRSNPNDELIVRPWSFALYRASSSTLTFAETLILKYRSANEVIYVAEVGYSLPLHTGVSGFFQRVGGVFGLAANVAFRHQKNHENVVPEINAFMTLRWQDLPWNRAVATSFAIGYGISYATAVPELEYITARSGEPQRLMNFLMLEATIALPSAPTTQLFTRIHHRSGTFGLMGPARVGSNAIAFGLRLHP